MHNCPNKQSDSDPIPTLLLKQCSSVLTLVTTNIANLSLTFGNFHSTLKESTITPILKKTITQDKEELSNYRPISNLSIISKIIERVVKSRLTEHLSTNNILNHHQSAYCKHNSTETALLYIHDYLINAIGSQKYHVSVFLTSLLHLILLTITSYCPSFLVSSWFGITGTVLDWFKSYLSSRAFRVKCESSFSSLHACFCGVPQGCVLGPLLFIMYTTPLSSLISSLSLNHHLYADDTQLFFSFHPPDVHSSLTHLHGALQQISSNVLILNSSKTEFLFIGLKQQLVKLQNISLDTTDSFWWKSYLLWSDIITLWVLLLSHSSTALHSPLSWLQDSQHHQAVSSRWMVRKQKMSERQSY